MTTPDQGIHDYYADCNRRAKAAWEKLCAARERMKAEGETPELRKLVRQLEKEHDYAAYTGD